MATKNLPNRPTATIAKPGPQNIPTAKPGTPDPVAQKAPKEPKRKPHATIAALKDNERIETIPPDFDFEKNTPIKRKQFKQDWDFFNYQAAIMDHRAANYRVQAEESKRLGAGSERAKAKRLVKLQDKINELKEQLQGQGVDIEALLSSVSS